jgi:hypothetical protein
MNPEPTLIEILGTSVIIGLSVFASLVVINKIHLYILKKFSKKD